MRKLALRLAGDERVRYLVVGGFNTLVGYGLYVFFYQVVLGKALSQSLGLYVASVLCVYASYVISVPMAFVLHRRFTFRVQGSGRVWVDFPRFCIVYLISLTVNTFALPGLEQLGLPPLLAQAVVVACVTVLTYVGHKLFSFRRSGGAVSGGAPDHAREESETGSVRTD